MKRRDVMERFWEKVRKSDGCWEWTAAKDFDGYGLFKLTKYVTVRAPRFAYETSVGVIGSLCVLHRCDTPSCVNPAHLFLGTRADNNKDKALKGRGRGRYSAAA